MKSKNGIPIFESGFITLKKDVDSNRTLDETYFVVKITANCTVSLPNPTTFEKHQYYLVNSAGIDLSIPIVGGGYIGNTGTATTLTLKAGECIHVKNDNTRWLILGNTEVGSGGGATNLTASSAISEPTWNGTTLYTKTITVTGAEVGDEVFVTFNNAMMSQVFLSGNYIQSIAGRVSATNTVVVYARIGTYLTIPVGSNWNIIVFK